MYLSKTVIAPVARAGYAARGIVYLVIAGFALAAALWAAEEKGSKGALRAIVSQSYGYWFAWLLVAGLSAYAIWRLVQGLFDTDHHGADAKGLAIRATRVLIAAIYASLAFYTLSLVAAVGGGTGGSQSVAGRIANFLGHSWTSLVLGMVFAGVAVAQWVRVWRESYATEIEASPGYMPAIHAVAKTGLTARGLVFAVISFLFLYRFWTARQDSRDIGTGDALSFVQHLPFGQILLAALALGLAAFAAYCFVLAIWRRIEEPGTIG